MITEPSVMHYVFKILSGVSFGLFAVSVVPALVLRTHFWYAFNMYFMCLAGVSLIGLAVCVWLDEG